jgi:hypothetical protein
MEFEKEGIVSDRENDSTNGKVDSPERILRRRPVVLFFDGQRDVQTPSISPYLVPIVSI